MGGGGRAEHGREEIDEGHASIPATTPPSAKRSTCPTGGRSPAPRWRSQTMSCSSRPSSSALTAQNTSAVPTPVTSKASATGNARQIEHQCAQRRAGTAPQLLGEGRSARRNVGIMPRFYRAHDVLGEELQHRQRDEPEEQPPARRSSPPPAGRPGPVPLPTPSARPALEAERRSPAERDEDRQRHREALDQHPDDRPVAQLADRQGKGASERHCAGHSATTGRAANNPALGLARRAATRAAHE